MRNSALLAAVVASLSLAGCAGHSAYGPDSEDRLDESIPASESKPAADAAALIAIHCKDQEKGLAAQATETDETKKLKSLGNIYISAKGNFSKLDQAASSQTDLLYGKEGDQIKANLEGCRETAAAAYSAFDRFTRELIDMPVVQEMKNRKMVNVPRVDFSILRTAIDKLEAPDREVLLNKLTMVEPTLGKEL